MADQNLGHTGEHDALRLVLDFLALEQDPCASVVEQDSNCIVPAQTGIFSFQVGGVRKGYGQLLTGQTKRTKEESKP